MGNFNDIFTTLEMKKTHRKTSIPAFARMLRWASTRLLSGQV
jgi:hypothetical protein